MNTKYSYFFSFTGSVELIITVVLPLLVIGATCTLPDSAGYFPSAMAGIMLFAGIMSIVFPPKKPEKSEATFIRNIILITTILIGFWFAVPLLGFYVSVAFLLLVFHVHFARKDDSFSVVKCIVFLCVSVGVLYVLFYKVLHVMTPKGLFF